MVYETVLYHVRDNVAVVTLNQPDTLNAVTSRMRAELAHAITVAGASARAVVLTATGRAFAAGQDFGPARTADRIDLPSLQREEYAPILNAIRHSAAPVICAVNGAASGAGANIALACDVVIAARSARFQHSEVMIGLMPDGGATWAMPRRIGVARALGMTMFGEPVTAEQAAEWGLIWEVVDDARLPARAAELAHRLATGPTRAYAAIRQAIRGGLTSDFDSHLETEAMLQGGLGKTRDFAEGLVSFQENRDPKFEGR